MKTIDHHFSRFAHIATHKTGRPATFALSVLFMLGWVAAGFYYHYSEAWWSAFDTVLTVVMFFILLLLQNSQNRDMRTIQMKLDELIHSHDKAPDELIEIEELPDKEIDAVREKRREDRSLESSASSEP
jgi:low affinity Fe/Cu permease